MESPGANLWPETMGHWIGQDNSTAQTIEGGEGRWSRPRGSRSPPSIQTRPEQGPMSKEPPKEDPRQHSDQATHRQTDKPWKGNPEKEQRNKDKIDLEKWQETNTH
jgi:hypothetical protein